MEKRDANYELCDEMELDEGFFSTAVSKIEKDEPLKRGRDSQKKTKVLVMTESEYIHQPKKCKKSRKVGHIKMKVIEDLKAHTIDLVVDECVSRQAHVRTNDSTSYLELSNKVEKHSSKVIPKKDINRKLLWGHIAISNAKGWLLRNFHKINKEYLQYYLEEFSYNLTLFIYTEFRILLFFSKPYLMEN